MLPLSLLPFLALGAVVQRQPANVDETQRLLALHQAAMNAHLHSDVEALLINESDDYVVANRGEITHPTKEDRRQKLGPYLEATTFEIYRDQVPPIVHVSEDGSLGWVIVQVYARGEQRIASSKTAPLEFISAWIELYEKRDGTWLRTGNVSNFKP